MTREAKPTRLLIVTSRLQMAQDAVKAHGANPSDPHIVYATMPDQWRGYDSDTPWVHYMATHFTPKEWVELDARFGDSKSMGAGLRLIGLRD